MLAAYVAGIILAWQQISISSILLLSLLVYLIIFLLIFLGKGKIINRHDRFVWLLPLLLLIAFLAMGERINKPELYNSFDEEISCELKGEIAKVAENKNIISLYLKDSIISIGDGKEYLCEKIIIKEKHSKSISSKSIKNDKSHISNTALSNGKPTASDHERQENAYRVGNKIYATGKLKKFSRARNPGNFNEELYYQIEEIFFYLDAEQIIIADSNYSPYHYSLYKIKKRLGRVYEQLLSSKEAGTVTAMLLGDKVLLDEETKRLYQENGVSHILAISGLHVSLIAMFFYRLLRWLKCPVLPASMLTTLFIYSYGVMTDFSVSTNRAIVMMVISLLAPITGRCYDMLSAICLSALIILMQNPMQILSAGFLLSYGAVLGIAVVYPALKLLFDKDERAKELQAKEARARGKKCASIAKLLLEIKEGISKSFLISLSTQLTTIPVVLFFFYQIPLYSIIINLIILPLVTILILLAFLGAIAGLVYLPAGVFVIGGANYILKLYELICRLGSVLPANLLTVGRPDCFKLMIYCICLCVFLILLCRYKSRTAFLVMAAGLLLLVLPKRNEGLMVTFLDVGQGDAIYIESASNTTYLVDGGSSDVSKAGIYRIKPFLLSRGRDVIDFAIISHSDWDHTGGLTEIINDGSIRVKNLILPDIAAKDDAYIRLEELAQQKNIPVSYISAGDSIRDGDILISCLHPVEAYNPPNKNAYSTVLSLQYHDFSLLLTGDTESDGEKMLIEHYPYAREYDLLKVAHHGSRNSTSEDFLSYTRPRIAVISCGKNNRYGHPHIELLERLKNIGCKPIITYESGAITIKTDGRRMAVDTMFE